ncbi:hypothetical protein PT974_07408 [Cladobotryum mycophilum]|uniref:Antifungal protein n=1 Tax=Cladobotryum mycophilum TaxID=491253 RepID=A0ABR0SP72_9HYPO
MKFLPLYALITTLSVVAAAPAVEPRPGTTPSNHPQALFKRRECPPDEHQSRVGHCNGTSCRSGWANEKCDFGKCVGDGGGDGSCCYLKWIGQHAYWMCPNGGW